MKKLTAILLSLVLILSLCSVAMLTVGAEETTASVWDGTANIKWYFDGKDGEYELKSAADLAGLAYIVNAGTDGTCYSGVYYDANYKVLGYRLSGTEGDYANSALVYTPTSGDGSQVVAGDGLVWQTVKLCVDVVLNEGNAADWATTAPANVWQPIGGGLHIDASSFGFNGTFDGQGHTISGLYYKGVEEAFACGLFGYAGKTANTEFKDLTITNFYVEGTYGVGALVGRSNKPIVVSNVLITDGIVKATNQQAAPLVASVFGGAATLENCGVSDVQVLGGKYLGAIVSLVNGMDFSATDCYATNVTVTGSDQCGAIIGRVAGGTIALKNVYVAAKLEAVGAEGVTTTEAGIVYGGIGNNSAPALGTIENVFYVKDISAMQENGITDIEGIVEVTAESLKGETAKTTLVGFDFDTVWKTVENGTPIIELREAPNQGGNETEEPGNNETEEPGNNETEAPGNNETEEPDNNETNAPETNAPETNAPTTTEKSGCGSVIGFASVCMIVLGASACMIRRKEN